MVIPYSAVPESQSVLRRLHEDRPKLTCSCTSDGPRITVRLLNNLYFFATFPNQSHLHSKDCRYQDQGGGASIQPVSLDNAAKDSKLLVGGRVELPGLAPSSSASAVAKVSKAPKKGVNTPYKASSHHPKGSTLDRLLVETWAATFCNRPVKESWYENCGFLINTMMTTTVNHSTKMFSDHCRICYFNPKSKRSTKSAEAQWFSRHFKDQTQPLFILGSIKSILKRDSSKGGGVRIALESFPRPLAIMSSVWDNVLSQQNDYFSDALLNSSSYCRLGLFQVRLKGGSIASPIVVENVGLGLVSGREIFR